MIEILEYILAYIAIHPIRLCGLISLFGILILFGFRFFRNKRKSDLAKVKDIPVSANEQKKNPIIKTLKETRNPNVKEVKTYENGKKTITKVKEPATISKEKKYHEKQTKTSKEMTNPNVKEVKTYENGKKTITKVKESAAVYKKKEYQEKQTKTLKEITNPNAKKVKTYENGKEAVTKVKGPTTVYKKKEYQESIISPISKKKYTEKLPTAKKENDVIEGEIKFVNYTSSITENEVSYPIVKIPKAGNIVRTHRLGSTKRRGYKEESFQKSLEKFFSSRFEISGDVRLNTGKYTRPFEPDIAIMCSSPKNIRIDIEIDEPYAGITRQPTHCEGEDINRDNYFKDRGWIVIRFSEYQIHTKEEECIRMIAELLNSIDSTFHIPSALTSTLKLEKEELWNIVQAQKWEKSKYREKYLNHTFSIVEDVVETIKRDFNKQEIEEEKLVKSTFLGIADKDKNIGFNKINTHHRDNRIKFYSEPHIYTIDAVPTPSASNVIARFFPEFDTIYWSERKASSLGMSAEKVAEMWAEKGKIARDNGKLLHEQIEKYYLKEDYSNTEEFYQFEQFVKDNSTLKPYRSEWRIFDEHHQIAGTIDLVVVNNNDFDIYDWKRSKKVINAQTSSPITSNSWQSGIGNLSHIDDTSFNRYCLQQSLYKYILEKNYKIPINKMYLVVMHPELDNYYKVEVPYMKKEIDFILKTV